MTHSCPTRLSSDLKVDRNAFLAGIHMAEIAAVAGAQRRPAAQVIAFRRFDLDDLCPQIRQPATAIGAGHHGGEVENAQVAERPAGMPGLERMAHVFGPSRGPPGGSAGPPSAGSVLNCRFVKIVGHYIAEAWCRGKE